MGDSDSTSEGAIRDLDCSSAGFTVCWLCLAFATGTQIVFAQPYPPPALTKDGAEVLLTDYACLPLSSRTPNGFAYTSYPPPMDWAQQLGRMNYLRSEPANAPLAAARFFICDLNRNFYIFDKSNRTFAGYLDFEAMFPKFDNNPGYAGGLVTFQFDPEYARNGVFYTVHTEDPIKNPVNSNAVLPAGYTATGVVNPPVGSVVRQGVLVEWTDTNIGNATFEGTARELLRIGFNGNAHPMADLIFNPLAQSGDEDYRNLYIACGDGGAGEQTDSRQDIPQRLDSLPGKTLRLTPDLNLRTNLSIVSPNGRYRIPAGGADPNPFVTTNGARGEVFTYGHRNPHRLAWDAESGTLLVFEIGLCSFEEVNIVHKGANYGYSEREGTKALVPPGGNYNTAPAGYGLEDLPANDTLPIRINGSATSTRVPVRYPVAEYFQSEGDAMANGFVYRGALMPAMHGKCIFGDITTGRLFYSDLAEMIAADDTNPATLAAVHELQVVFDSPTDEPDQGITKRRMFDIVRDEYHRRGGTAVSLPGTAAGTSGNDPDGVPYGGGRADIRLAQGGDGELYLLSKSDGTIRQLTSRRTNLPPSFDEPYPPNEDWPSAAPFPVAVGAPQILRTDVDDDSGAGRYTCVWVSDRGPIETKTNLSNTGSFECLITYTPTAPDLGVRSITLTVEDPEGLSRSHAFILNIVDSTNLPPGVAITWPAPNSSFAAGQAITISAKADDRDGTVAQLEFFANGASIGTVAAGGPAQILWQPAPSFYQLTVVATDDRGMAATSAPVSVRVTNSNASGAFLESAGLVVIEAEHFTNSAAASGHTWVTTNNVAGFIGDSAMQAVPNSGASITANIPATSPGLTYAAQFATTGTYMFWVRGWGANGADDSVHLGVDGQWAQALSYSTTGAWMWRVSQVTIASPGLHSINLWMREDGAYVDRLLLTTNLAFTPTGAGPPESARIAGMTNLPPSVAITDPANGAMFLAGAPVIVSAGASDADGVVTRVEFFANGSSIGTDTNAPYEASFSPVPGDYVLTAAAADDDAKTTIAAAVAMNIGPAPTVFPALTVFIENGRLRLTYEIPPELRFFDIVVVKSSNLLSWTPGENLFEEITRTQSGNGWQRVTLLTPVSQLTAGPMYFRLAKRDGP